MTNEPHITLLHLSDVTEDGLNTSGHRRGIISLDGTCAGIIEETPRGSRFTYDIAYLARPKVLAISPTLPLRPEPYDSPGLHPRPRGRVTRCSTA